MFILFLLKYFLFCIFQVGLAESISGAYDQICRVLPLPEVARLVTATLDTLVNRVPLVKAKLVAIDTIVQGKLFLNNG